MNENFTADGLRRNPTTWNGSASSVDLSVSAGVTRQGYTWQIALGNMGLNHMNGRVQDAITGVFLSPDPYISEPGNPQNYNRYSYVLNNPLSFTDPSGYRRKKKTGNISKKNQPPKYTLEEVLVTAERYEPHYLSDILDTVNFGRDLINGIADFLDRLVNFDLGSSSSGGDVKNTEEHAPQGDSCGNSVVFKCHADTRPVCTGQAYVMAGNPANIGKIGFPGVTVTDGSAAVVPSQWTGYATAGPLMRSIGSSAMGTVTSSNGATQSFNGITQPIGYLALGTAAQVQSMIMQRAPGQLVLELVGGRDFGAGNSVFLDIPKTSAGCPQGTQPVGGN